LAACLRVHLPAMCKGGVPAGPKLLHSPSTHLAGRLRGATLNPDCLLALLHTRFKTVGSACLLTRTLLTCGEQYHIIRGSVGPQACSWLGSMQATVQTAQHCMHKLHAAAAATITDAWLFACLLTFLTAPAPQLLSNTNELPSCTIYYYPKATTCTGGACSDSFTRRHRTTRSLGSNTAFC
jgi:hypothetical protein